MPTFFLRERDTPLSVTLSDLSNTSPHFPWKPSALNGGKAHRAQPYAQTKMGVLKDHPFHGGKLEFAAIAAQKAAVVFLTANFAHAPALRAYSPALALRRHDEACRAVPVRKPLCKSEICPMSLRVVRLLREDKHCFAIT